MMSRAYVANGPVDGARTPIVMGPPGAGVWAGALAARTTIPSVKTPAIATRQGRNRFMDLSSVAQGWKAGITCSAKRRRERSDCTRLRSAHAKQQQT